MLVQKFDSEFSQESDEHLRISYQMEQGCLIYQLQGTLDSFNTYTLRHKLELAKQHGFYRIILDCQQLECISSTGVGAVTAFLSPLKKHGGNIIFVGVSEGIRQVFTLVGFGHFVTFCDSIEQGLQVLQR